MVIGHDVRNFYWFELCVGGDLRDYYDYSKMSGVTLPSADIVIIIDKKNKIKINHAGLLIRSIFVQPP